jgi:hypothetical protein
MIYPKEHSGADAQFYINGLCAAHAQTFIQNYLSNHFSDYTSTNRTPTFTNRKA